MPLVKLTIYPEPREIPADEIPVLRSQGLIEDEDLGTGENGTTDHDDEGAGDGAGDDTEGA